MDERQAEIQTDKQIDIQIEAQTDRYKQRQIDRQCLRFVENVEQIHKQTIRPKISGRWSTKGAVDRTSQYLYNRKFDV